MIALCVLLALQSAGIVRPLGVGWGDGVRGRGYLVQADRAIVLRTASGMKPAPPGNYPYAVQPLGRFDAVGVHYVRWNMTAGRTPTAPVLGTFAGLRITAAWPVLVTVALGCPWVAQAG